MDYKYRTRRICHIGELDEKTITEYRKPAKDDTDLVFAVYQNKDLPKTLSLYQDLVRSFAKTLDRMGKGKEKMVTNDEGRLLYIHLDDS